MLASCLLAGDLLAGDLLASCLLAGDLLASWLLVGGLLAGDLLASCLVAGGLLASCLLAGDLLASCLLTGDFLLVGVNHTSQQFIPAANLQLTIKKPQSQEKCSLLSSIPKLPQKQEVHLETTQTCTLLKIQQDSQLFFITQKHLHPTGDLSERIFDVLSNSNANKC
jgi:hypothetical protein